MAFFLLGRSDDGALSLLSHVAFESRQDALAELGNITGDPAFDRWDDEVLLIDLDAGTPVLLVRPSGAAATPVDAYTPELESEPESAVFAAIADEEPDETLAEVEAATDEEPQPTHTETPVVEPESEVEAEEAVAGGVAAVAEAADEEGMGSLRAALARTTEQMEASGIVAPDSIGPADEAAEESEPGQDTVGAEPGPSEGAEIPAPEQPAWPWATESEPVPSMTEDRGDTPEPDVSFVLDGLEEPAIDAGGSLITSSIDDESLAATRPVILGAYGESPAVESPADSEGLDAGTAEVSAPADDSDFIILDPASDTSEAEPADATEAAVVKTPSSPAADDDDLPALSSYVCSDCVYVDTCPNKDQRRPEDCGSFQWK